MASSSIPHRWKDDVFISSSLIMASSSSILHPWKYDVFVSFRGEDIRKNFMDHLFSDFKQKGIYAFRDNDLPKGEEIYPQLDKAIEESRFLIVVFSKNYASSSWCLRELVKILKCKQMENPKYEVRVIFYDAKPDVVRKQQRSSGEALGKHEVSNTSEVDKSKEALSMAANLSGWDLQDMTNGYESKFIDSISKEILKQLCDGPLHVDENLIGIDIHLDKLDLLRFVGSDKVNMIGICGISGIGKTTLAKAIYNLMYIRFEGSSFCDDIQGVSKRQGLTQVQMQLIDDIMKTRAVKISNVGQGIMVIKKIMSSKPVMLVLDDVDHREQLEALAGSPSWFCPGSLIIFTGKEKQLLRSHRIKILDMEFLAKDESLELFSSYAFEETQTCRGFEELAEKAVKYVQGHPLALKILGCFLFGKSVGQWVSELDSLEEHPNEEIQRVLRLSYDGLNLRQKNILLDIACLFIGENSDFAASVLDNFFADTNMRVLVDKSLISISSNMSLQMHDMIRAMAREIVREESTMLGKHRRLWIPSEVYDVLSEKKVTITEAVEVLVLLLEKSCQKSHIDTKAFAHMKKLRILKIYQKEEFEQELELKGYNVNFSGSLSFLSNELRLFYWHGFPFKDLPSDFYPENIVAINLSYSHINHLWTTPKCLKRLKVMNLSYCRNLRSTPDCTEITNLEELYLDGCVNLVEVHPSIGMLKRLSVLNMSNCKRLKSFPSKLDMDSLQVLNISGCSLMDFKTFGRNERIQSRWWTSISRAFYLPSKQEHPQSLVLSSLTGLPLLRKLNLSYCNLLQVPDSIGGLSCLEVLYLKGNNFTRLPESLSQLSSLSTIHLDDCKKVEVLPDLPHRLSRIYAPDCTSLRELLGSSNHQTVNRLNDFSNCPRLFKNLVTIDSQVSVNQTQCLDSSIDSQGSTNQQMSSLLWYTGIPTNICEFFRDAESLIHLDIAYYANSNIPKWFRNQSMGDHVKVELPSDWCYTKFRGFGTCVVFKHKKTKNIFKGYSVKNFNGTLMVDSSGFYIPYFKKERWIGINEPYTIWVNYRTRRWDMEEAKNYVTFDFFENEDLEVKECGVRLVCDEDLQQTAHLLSTIPTPTQDGGYMRLYNERYYGDTFWSW